MTVDHLSNLLTSLRNAELAKHSSTKVWDTKLSRAVLTVLKEKNYISDFAADATAEGKALEVTLTSPSTQHHFRRISKPSRRMYVDAKSIPTVRQGQGMLILSTSEGVMSSQDARKKVLGGEILCEVY